MEAITASGRMPRLPMAALLAAALFAGQAADRAGAQDGEWQVAPLATPGAVREIRQLARGAAVSIEGAWHRVTRCAQGWCTAPAALAPAARPPAGGLRDGGVATFDGPGLVRAWYSAPTRRYGHGVLGDAVEAGALVGEDASGRRHRLDLPADEVFEDLTPRLADLDGDGSAEVVAIRSSLERGAALAVAGLRDGRLTMVAATPEIGQANRWLNVAGIADFDGDGRREIAIVVTPHIGGRLEFWRLEGARLRRLAMAHGFSNHVIGSRALGLSSVLGAGGEDGAQLIVPDAARRALAVVRLRRDRIVQSARVALPGRVALDMARLSTGNAPAVVVGLDDGRAVVIARPARR